jgi:hypothetical protein
MQVDTENLQRAPHHVHGHGLLKGALIAAALWLLLPVFGLGLYKNSSGDISFDLWYLLVFMVIGLVLMHEFIAPLPPKEHQ